MLLLLYGTSKLRFSSLTIQNLCFSKLIVKPYKGGETKQMPESTASNKLNSGKPTFSVTFDSICEHHETVISGRFDIRKIL